MGIGTYVHVVDRSGRTITKGFIRGHMHTATVWPVKGDEGDEFCVKGEWYPASWCIPAR
jgi:UDP-2,3-diacylglucosamine pyrophosphatase LpxH